jgi:hypothetical protein
MADAISSCRYMKVSGKFAATRRDEYYRCAASSYLHILRMCLVSNISETETLPITKVLAPEG